MQKTASQIADYVLAKVAADILTPAVSTSRYHSGKMHPSEMRKILGQGVGASSTGSGFGDFAKAEKSIQDAVKTKTIAPAAAPKVTTIKQTAIGSAPSIGQNLLKMLKSNKRAIGIGGGVGAALGLGGVGLHALLNKESALVEKLAVSPGLARSVLAKALQEGGLVGSKSGAGLLAKAYPKATERAFATSVSKMSPKRLFNAGKGNSKLSPSEKYISSPHITSSHHKGIETAAKLTPEEVLKNTNLYR